MIHFQFKAVFVELINPNNYLEGLPGRDGEISTELVAAPAPPPEWCGERKRAKNCGPKIAS